MAITAWAPKGSRKYEWLMQQADDYLDAKQKANLSEWFPDLFRRYFEEFPITLPSNTDANALATLDAEEHNPSTQAHSDSESLGSLHDKTKEVC